MSEAKEENNEDCGNQDGFRPILYQQETDRDQDEGKGNRKKTRPKGHVCIHFPKIPSKQCKTGINRQEKYKEGIFFHIMGGFSGAQESAARKPRCRGMRT